LILYGVVRAQNDSWVTMADRVHVFVYGTLKRNFHNFVQMRGAQFEGEYKTVEKFPLIIIPLGEDVSELHSYVPALYNKPGIGHQILGEIFSVDKEHLGRLDEFEECHICTSDNQYL
jgi:gamma-glutamylaminecyclotransferase